MPERKINTILGKPVPASPPDTSPLNSSMVILAGQNVEKFNKNDKYRIFLGTALPNFLLFLYFLLFSFWSFLGFQKSLRKGGSWKNLDQRRKLGSAVPRNLRRSMIKKTKQKSKRDGFRLVLLVGKTGNEGINKLLLTTPVARPGSWFL